MLLIGVLDFAIICFPLLFVLCVFCFEFLLLLKVSLLSGFSFFMEIADRLKHIIVKFIYRSWSLFRSLTTFIFLSSNQLRMERTGLSDFLVLLLFFKLLLRPCLIELFETTMVKFNVFV